MNFAKHWAAVLDDYVIDLAWSPDGALLAAAAQSGSITLLDAASGAVRHKPPGHADGTNALAWAPSQRTEDGGRKTETANQSSALGPLSAGFLASGGQDGCVRFWDAATGHQTAETNLGGAWVEHLVWSGTGLPTRDSEATDRETRATFLLYAAAGKKLAALRADGSLAHAFPDAPKTISALATAPSSALGSQSSALASACFGHVVV